MYSSVMKSGSRVVHLALHLFMYLLYDYKVRGIFRFFNKRGELL